MATVITLPLGWWAALDHGPVPLPGPVPPSAWRVPVPRNREFVGRDDVLAALHRELSAGRTAAVQALRGMGGIGKTQVAAEYAYRHAASYRIVWWIAAEDAALIGEQFAVLSTVLGLSPPGDSGAHVAAHVIRYLREHDDWLLIFDNAGQSADLAPWLPGAGGHTIVTSRGGLWGQSAAVIDLCEMPRGESVALLRTGNPGMLADDADRLAAALSDLPLALVQAAGFMASSGAGVREYLDLMSADPAQVLDLGPAGAHAGCLTATVAIGTGRLAQLDPGALTLLRVCASLGPEPIPTRWLLTPADAERTLQLRRNIGHLKNLGLVVADEDSIQLHRLTRAIVVGLMTGAERTAAHRRAEEILCAGRPDDTDNPLLWPVWAPLVPHLLAVRPAGSANPALRELTCDACRYLLRRGDIDAGHDLADAVHRAWHDRLGREHPDTLTAANHLAHAFELQGRYREALILAQGVLDRRRQTLGDDHPDTLLVAGRVAVYLYHTGDFELARQRNVDILARRTRVLGEDHPDTVRTAANLATCLRDLGEFEAARLLDDDAFRRRQRVLGDDHPDTLGSATNRAYNFRHLGDLDQARRIDEDILARRQAVLGEHHPDTIFAANNLAKTLRSQGEFTRARRLNEETLGRARQVLGNDHPQTLSAAVECAADLHAAGEHRQARQLQEETLVRLRREHHDGHPVIQELVHELATDERGLS